MITSTEPRSIDLSGVILTPAQKILDLIGSYAEALPDTIRTKDVKLTNCFSVATGRGDQGGYYVGTVVVDKQKYYVMYFYSEGFDSSDDAILYAATTVDELRKLVEEYFSADDDASEYDGAEEDVLYAINNLVG